MIVETMRWGTVVVVVKMDLVIKVDSSTVTTWRRRTSTMRSCAWLNNLEYVRRHIAENSDKVYERLCRRFTVLRG